MKRGDVVLVVLQGELGKPRPGVVVQADELDASSSTIVCPMSSHIDSANQLRPVIAPTVQNGLLVRTQIMTDKLNTLRRDRVKRVIGTLDSDARERLNSALLLVLGLAR
ncbi:MAG TPA: type II toxin-antitoxin system PemK/MazF family toxin [Bradyrhizobium sp.]|nr:type II toxin-antitoxin system PemK/MazF family toxin [Bradyrhizobium sp.]